MHGLIFVRTYNQKDIVVLDLGTGNLFSGGLIIRISWYHMTQFNQVSI